MKSWFSSTPADDWVSMGVFSDGSYDTPEGVMFSFPITIKAGLNILQLNPLIGKTGSEKSFLKIT